MPGLPANSEQPGAVFADQFLLSRNRVAPWPNFRSRALLAGYHLHTAADLPIVDIVREGTKLGVLLGYPVDLANASGLEAGATLTVDAFCSVDDLVEQLYDRLAGSFIFISDCGEAPRLYLDACGTFSLVYDRQRQLVAATALLLLGDEYDNLLRHDLFRAFEVGSDGWFSAGLTAHRGVERLLVNHYLDLADFSAIRHWPTSLPPYCDEPQAVVGAIGDEVALVCQAVAKIRPTVIALTGGYETRALLACSRDYTGQVQFVTVAVPGGQRDLHLATQLVRLTGIDHLVLPLKVADEDGSEQWMKLAGHCLTGMNRKFFPSVDPLAGKVLIGGLGGEVGRGFLWPAQMTADDQISAVGLVDLLKLPRHPVLIEKVEQWLGNLPASLDPWQVLDLAYIELRMGTWAFAQAYANPVKLDLHPLISRRQFARMLSLPPGFRAGGGLMQSLVKLLWPELLQVPVNAYGDWRDKLSIASRAVRQPDRAWRKLRQILRRRLG